ncbi:hypothetical protein [Thauera sp. SDU_THAU2]|uniref:hypothetical protein n=1 Tax=Thauera sp. SDU_THAU2 TaxID=3136633 RepID=UPI00311EF19E
MYVLSCGVVDMAIHRHEIDGLCHWENMAQATTHDPGLSLAVRKVLPNGIAVKQIHHSGLLPVHGWGSALDVTVFR